LSPVIFLVGRTTFFNRWKSTQSSPLKARWWLLPGVGDHGMFDIVITRQPGRPCASLKGLRVCRTTEEGERQMSHRESDSLVVPKKAGNAAGGKEATHGSVV
jgi:hypothetical protein